MKSSVGLKVSCSTCVIGVAIAFAGSVPVNAQDTAPTPPMAEGAAVPQAAADASNPATPAASSGAGLQEIVVTAERRAVSVQKTPISISAVGGDALKTQQITNVEALASSLPNVSFGRDGGEAKIFIRGVGVDSVAPGGETRVAVYTDGIYQPRSQAAFVGFYDVDRVEVLRGPQGTLYGRNATAGAVNIISRGPTDQFDGYLSGTVGNYGLIMSEGAVGGPLADGLSGRIAFRTTDRSGYGENIQTGHDVDDEHSRNVRARLKYQPASNLTINLEGSYSHELDRNAGYHWIAQSRPDITPLGNQLGTVPTDPQDVTGPDPRNHLDTAGASVSVDWKVGPGTKIVAVSGFNWEHLFQRGEIDGTTADVSRWFDRERSHSYSNELRLEQDLGSFGHILIGGYQFHETNFAGLQIPIDPALIGLPNILAQGYQAQGTVHTNAYAAFSQADLTIAKGLNLSLGLRYSSERKSIAEAQQLDLTTPYSPSNPFTPFGSDNQHISQHSLDPKVTLSYQFAPTIFGYATYSRGFKSGGFNIGGLQPPFRPEKLTNYEIGLKTEMFDHKLRANLSAFIYDYKDLQVNIVEGIAIVTRNAAQAKVKGVEAEITALPVDGLKLSFDGSYLDAYYTKFSATEDAFPELGPQNLAGNRLNYAPKWKVDGEIGYTFQTSFGPLTPRVQGTWVDRVYFSQFNRPNLSQPAHAELNFFINYETNNKLWSANFFLRNATNKVYITGATTSTGLIGYAITGQYSAPRTVGFQVTRHF
jgi:iron complex outermembrane recepter protein